MNWIAVTALAEVFGVIAVIVSLVYLAFQIRQSNHVAQAAAANQISGRFIDWMYMMASKSNVRKCFVDRRQIADTATISDVTEALGLIQVLLKIIEEMHFQHRKGFVDTDLWRGWKVWFANMKSYEIVQDFYSAKRSNYSQAFCLFWDDLVATDDGSLRSIVEKYSGESG